MPNQKRRQSAAPRRGLTLTELLIVSAVLTIIVGGMGVLTLAVGDANSYCRGQTAAVQHGRVAGDRIEQALRVAYTTEHFPGCRVITTTVDGYEFPDALAVWVPSNSPTEPTGMPRVGELRFFLPNPTAPEQLLEIRPAASNVASVPAMADEAAWRSLVTNVLATANTSRIELTDRLRTASAASNNPLGATSGRRGCVRFEVFMTPDAASWAAYRAGTTAWSALDWPLDLRGTQTGQRRIVCQYELQIDGTGTGASILPILEPAL